MFHQSEFLIILSGCKGFFNEKKYINTTKQFLWDYKTIIRNQFNKNIWIPIFGPINLYTVIYYN